jgi:hypothetical protein
MNRKDTYEMTQNKMVQPDTRRHQEERKRAGKKSKKKNCGKTGD